MKTTYPNGIGPNWMDRYVDPDTGKKFKWTYKPAKTVMGCYRQTRSMLNEKFPRAPASAPAPMKEAA